MRQRNRRMRVGVGFIAGLALLVGIALPAMGMVYVIDLTTAGASVTYQGAVFTQGPLPGSAGTGVLDPFLRIGANNEQVEGYNTNYRYSGNKLQFQEDPPWTEALLLSAVPIREVGGDLFRVLYLDINQINGTPFSLDELKLFIGDSPLLHSYDKVSEAFVGGTSNKIWDLDEGSSGDAYVDLEYSLQAGSGDADMTMLVPEATFDSAGANCDYGQAGCSSFLYVYSRFGDTYENNDGFEEWSTEILPFVQVSKTATGTFDRAYAWDITKTGAPLTHNLFAGGGADTDYDIFVDQMVTDTNIRVTGSVTITVPAKVPDGDENAPDAVVTSLSDVFTQGVTSTNGTFTDCAAPFTVEAGESRVCAYSLTPPSAAAGVNEVTVLIEDNSTAFKATAGVGAFTPSITGFENVDVTDTFPYPGGTPELIGDEVAADTTLDNDQAFTCSTNPNDYTNGFYSYTATNRATILETGDVSEETVTVNCYAPVVSKTADGAFTKTYTWTIDKSGDPLTHNLWAGDSADTDYDIAVDQIVVNSSFAVSGSITVQNPNPNAAMTVNLTDTLSTGGSVAITCPAAADPAALVIPAKSGGTNGSVTCSYSGTPTGAAEGQSGSNTATATINGGGFTGSDTWAFDTYTTVGSPTVNVTDTFPFPGGAPGALGSASGDHTFVNDQTFACSSDPDDYTDGWYSYQATNQATITETGQTDSETVTVNCYAPVVSKTAAERYTRTFSWTINKSGSPLTHSLWAGDDADTDYDIVLDKTVDDSGFEVYGDITVQNPNPGAAMDVDLADAIGTIDAVINCGGGAGDTTLTVPAGGSASCSYVVDLGDGDKPADGTNTATVTFNEIDFTGTAGFAFGDPTTVVGDENVDVNDTFPYPGGTPELIGDGIAADANLDNDQTFECSSDPGDYTNGTYSYARTNRAEIVETGQYDEETVTVNCYAPVVSKTADGSFDKDWDWTIDKSANQTTLELAVGQQFLVDYTVTVSATATKFNYEVAGVISVENPNPTASMDVVVADEIGTAPAVIDCGTGDGDTTLTVAAGATGTCDYFVDLGDTKPTQTTNTATVAFNSIDFVATDDFDFVLDSETDECIDVTDDKHGALGTVCASDSPRTFNYSMFVGPYDVCGEYEHINTASFVAKDEDGEADDTGSDSWTVDISIECGGCTLTQGYWKTHSERGPAPYDETWATLDAWYYSAALTQWVEGDGVNKESGEEFFLPTNGATWYDVFWTAPAGNAYFNLAHQYQAAVLNILNDASAPASVTAAIADAEALFKQYTPAGIGALKGNNPLRKQFISRAGTLASYNEGKIGPGHCDEDSLSSKAP